MINRNIILWILTIAVFISSIFFIFMAYNIVTTYESSVFGCFLGGCGLGISGFVVVCKIGWKSIWI